jgi:hypothetical protein
MFLILVQIVILRSRALKLWFCRKGRCWTSDYWNSIIDRKYCLFDFISFGNGLILVCGRRRATHIFAYKVSDLPSKNNQRSTRWGREGTLSSLRLWVSFGWGQGRWGAWCVRLIRLKISPYSHSQLVVSTSSTTNIQRRIRRESGFLTNR